MGGWGWWWWQVYLNTGVITEEQYQIKCYFEISATGFIDLKGFLSVYGKILQNEQDEEDLRQAFRVLDKNRRGEIDVDDLRWILKELGDDLTEEEIDEMIRDTDRDGSGFVDFDGEFQPKLPLYIGDTCC